MSPPEGLGGSRRRTWPLVLDALGLPRWLAHTKNLPVLIVPCLVEKLARKELGEFDAEERHPHLPSLPEPLYGQPALSLLLLVPVAFFFFLKAGDLGFSPTLLGLPRAVDWTGTFGLDTIRVRLFGEVYRALTALFLHQDIAHLAGNLAFSCLFLQLLARVTGPGLAMLLTLFGGMCGNVLDAFLRTQAIVSIGYSTALFATIGALSGVLAGRRRGGALLPLAAGAALLSLLGTEGENTDYLAHVGGLLSGMGLGFATRFLLNRLPEKAVRYLQWPLGLVALGIACASLWLV